MLNYNKKGEYIMVNIYDTANQLEREVRELEQFKALEEAFDALQKEEKSFKTFKEFQELQVSLQEKQMSGQEITEDDAKKMQELFMQVQNDDLINVLFEKEQALSQIMNDITAMMMKPVQDLYGF